MFQAEPESGTCYPYGYGVDETNSPLPGSPSVSPNKNRKVLNLENLKKDIYQMG